MFDDKNQKLDNSPKSGTASLEGAKTSGDKSQLLEELVTEGKLATSPYQGPTALINETTVSAREIILHAVTGASTEDMQAAKNLPQDMKIVLMDRVLEQYPNTSIREIKAICAELEIDPKQFIKDTTEKITKELKDSMEQIKTSRDFDDVVLNLFYRDSEAVSIVDANIEKSLGKGIYETLASKTNDFSQKVSLELSLIGQTGDPYLDLQRMQALLTFERRQQARNSVPLSTAQEIHIEKMQKYLAEAEKFLKDIPGGEGAAGAAFYDHLKKSQKSFSDYVHSKTWWQKNPAAFRAILITLLLVLSLFIIEDKQNQLLYWTSTIAFGLIVFVVGNNRLQKTHQKLKESAINQYTTEAEIRGFKKSQRLKARLK